jgi:hypothetical protein
LGLPGVGKRSLLERLKGKDPFDQTEQAPQPSPNSSQAVVPYQPPPGFQMADRVEIKVIASQDVILRSTSDSRIDFVVILINPKEDPKLSLQHISQVISDLLEAYQQLQQQSAQNTATFALRICFLINFRDIHNSKKKGGFQEGELQQSVVEMLQQRAQYVPNPEQVLLQFGTISLYNCYGLSILHHFLYVSYLRLKRREIELQLALIDEQTSKAQEVPRIKYKEFLKLANQTEAEAASHAQDHQHHHHRDGMKGPDHHRSPKEESEHQGMANGDDFPVDYGQRRTTVISDQVQGPHLNEQVSTPAPENVKDALEAFLASDDEEEGQGAKTEGPPSTYGDDDDDDYFYNENGERISTGNRDKATPSMVTKKQEKHAPEQQASVSTPGSSLHSKSETMVVSPSDLSNEDTIKVDAGPMNHEDKAATSKEIGGMHDESETYLEDLEKASCGPQTPGEPSGDTTTMRVGHHPTIVAEEKAAGPEKAGDASTHEIPEEPTVGSLDHEMSAKGATVLSRYHVDKIENGEKSGYDNDDIPRSQPVQSVTSNDDSEVASDEALNSEMTTRTQLKIEQAKHAIDRDPRDEPKPDDSNEDDVDSVSTQEQDGEPEENGRLRTDASDTAIPSVRAAFKDGNYDNGFFAEETEACHTETDNASVEAVEDPTLNRDSDDEEEFFIDETEGVLSSEAARAAISKESDDEGGESDDEFFVGARDSNEKEPAAAEDEEKVAKAGVEEHEDPASDEPLARHSDLRDQKPKNDDEELAEQQPASAVKGQQREATNTVSSERLQEPPAQTQPSGLSSAAQAAIAAARKEAELMLLQSNIDHVGPPKPSKKEKKKQKEAKKAAKAEKKDKKKGKKEKRVAETTESTDQLPVVTA